MKRRNILGSLFIVGGANSIELAKWSKPIVNAVILPAHAQTSNGLSCSEITEEQISESISIEITSTQAIGPISVEIIGSSFSGEQMSDSGMCASGTGVLSQTVVFSGTINEVNSQISGVFDVFQFCDGELVCEQRTTFLVTQSPINPSSNLGTYIGNIDGTLRCCQGAG